MYVQEIEGLGGTGRFSMVVTKGLGPGGLVLISVVSVHTPCVPRDRTSPPLVHGDRSVSPLRLVRWVVTFVSVRRYPPPGHPSFVSSSDVGRPSNPSTRPVPSPGVPYPLPDRPVPPPTTVGG